MKKKKDLRNKMGKAKIAFNKKQKNNGLVAIPGVAVFPMRAL